MFFFLCWWSMCTVPRLQNCTFLSFSLFKSPPLTLWEFCFGFIHSVNLTPPYCTLEFQEPVSRTLAEVQYRHFPIQVNNNVQYSKLLDCLQGSSTDSRTPQIIQLVSFLLEMIIDCGYCFAEFHIFKVS